MSYFVEYHQMTIYSLYMSLFVSKIAYMIHGQYYHHILITSH